MKKISGYVSVKALGCYDFEFYVEDDATEEEIASEVEKYCEFSSGYTVETGYKKSS